MSLSQADIAYAQDLFSQIPDLNSRRMFGGLGLYSGKTIFALMRSDGAVLIKATGGAFAAKLADLGCQKWTYVRKDGAAAAMPYWRLPETALDEPAQAAALARQALGALAAEAR